MLFIQDSTMRSEVSYEDMVRYHGRAFIGGVAMGYKLLELASETISNGVLERASFRMVSAVSGPGILDAVELATRARSRGALTVDAGLAKQQEAVDAADGQGGKYYFEIFYKNRQLQVRLKDGVAPEEFLLLARKTHDGSISAAEKTRLQQLKEEIAAFIMTKRATELFEYSIIAEGAVK